ncbi:ABC transporter substrate-binding protein [Subsaximicrobium wynnwilliamsii]|uniref:ABC transporter substrate-binding protein n=1 Tax=Subsaximicrobium wynnwilliamsii TaxID=291179 RepID=A0A5C6ZEF7_9FLAO|nr:helical backbone metal receptor [Subsaximicrobium wynnwilliamsii]TXD81847.1 ABC transporter substrate-binding protein [Subsaximicrobium wynnwilliamsii]TXD87516.1 ABC transporter substrate-binding protein [Subsaximicrobium wynnwilliamsii]TXE01199.1 ABC transporter substrate-binding protein [Subsaximicrobium wynnwilliamsii]
MKDQLGNLFKLASTPKRIVSLVPSQTELLVDLGLESSLVGITKFCVHPEELRNTKVIVGGTKQVHLDEIRGLKPDVILCNKEENTEEMVKELKSIAPVHISDVHTFEDALELIKMYGEMFSAAQKAQHLIEGIQKEKQQFSKFLKERPRYKVAYLIWKKPWMVVAKQTFIDEMLSLNNFENSFKDFERYPEIELAEIGERHPDVILLSSEPYPFKEDHQQDLEAIFPKTKIVLVDGEYFSWYGSRLLKAFDYFRKLHQNHLD